MTDGEVTIKTPDGTCDAFSYIGERGRGVLLWPDIFGLRPDAAWVSGSQSRVTRAGRQSFYRAQKAPTRKGAATGSRPDAVDAGAEQTTHSRRRHSSRTDQQPSVAKNRRSARGLLHGRLIFRTAAAVPDRVGAVASFHGGGLVDPKGQPNSPHLQAAKNKAQFLIAIAENDDARAPKDKDVLKETFSAAKLPAEIEVYSGAHGWCPPDSGVYKEDQAEKAWTRLLALYGKALA